MQNNIALILLVAAAAYILFKYRSSRKRLNLQFIHKYDFPSSIQSKLKKEYPELKEEQLPYVIGCLREYFKICGISRMRKVSMPSKVVDFAWHEFILNTFEYNSFCKQAYGKFLHHIPSEGMKNSKLSNDGMKRTWKISCKLNDIDSKNPDRLPKLFSIDKDFNIKDGFYYEIDCGKKSSPLDKYGNSTPIYCATDIGCSSYSGGISNSGIGDDFSNQGDSGSGHSCGGDSGGGSSCSGGD